MTVWVPIMNMANFKFHCQCQLEVSDQHLKNDPSDLVFKLLLLTVNQTLLALLCLDSDGY